MSSEISLIGFICPRKCHLRCRKTSSVVPSFPQQSFKEAQCVLNLTSLCGGYKQVAGLPHKQGTAYRKMVRILRIPLSMINAKINTISSFEKFMINQHVNFRHAFDRFLEKHCSPLVSDGRVFLEREKTQQVDKARLRCRQRSTSLSTALGRLR